MFKLFCSILIAILSTTICHANPTKPSENVLEKNSAGAATQSLAINLLKHNKNSNENIVFSPFGFSSILTFLGEGAKGDTFKQISTALKHSSDVEKVRLDYKEVLKYLQGDNPLVAPQFKSWLYVYANNTVEDAYRNILANNYFVEVKQIQREIFDWNEPKTSIQLDVENKSISKSDDDVGQEDEQIVATTEISADSTTSVNSKDIIGFEDLKKSEPFDEEPSVKTNEPIVEKETSKFDETIDNKEYVEISDDQKVKDILDETRNEIIEDNEAINDNEKLEGNLKKVGANQIQDGPVKIRLPLKKLEDSLEIMLALESHPIRKRYFSGRTLEGHPGDIASALSGNSLVGEKAANENDVEGSENNDGYESKMLMFNGLYFRGSWGIPFQQLRSDPEHVFYVTSDLKKPIMMMRSRGNFKVAEVKEMGLQAIELPYENKRYSMLIILPNAQQNLVELIDSLTEDCFAMIQTNLKEEMISMSLPKFRIESISRAEKSLIKSGVTNVFSPNADFSGITQEQKIHLEELVQHVTFRVDEGASSENFLTATEILEERSAAADATERNLSVNRPFLYFVRDIQNDVIIVAGIYSQPQVLDETPVAVDTAEDNEE